ncbi:hypothetical protein niasHS_008003 [Heterodera schachtii]|uniref:arabinogalactan endo-beta-1,4-galactanase n=1 Tax=Heterodera schachtii TaxID=97005 RepID=A0ABD2J766_HETSC
MASKLAFLFIATVVCLTILLMVQIPCQIDAHPAVRVKLANSPAGKAALGLVPGGRPAQGMALMIDFHYADSWADPGQQPIPSAWKGHSLEQLVTDVYKHTYEVLSYLKSISVLWVQVGNEINNGMLWPIAKTPNYAAISKLINSGYKASKAVYPNALRLR